MRKGCIFIIFLHLIKFCIKWRNVTWNKFKHFWMITHNMNFFNNQTIKIENIFISKTVSIKCFWRIFRRIISFCWYIICWTKYKTWLICIGFSMTRVICSQFITHRPFLYKDSFVSSFFCIFLISLVQHRSDLIQLDQWTQKFNHSEVVHLFSELERYSW